LQPLAQAAAAGIRVEPPGKAIDERYRELRDYVGTAPGAPIEQAYKAMDALRQQLARLAQPGAAPTGVTPTGATPATPVGEDATALLRSEALSAPAPVNRWLEAMIGSSTALRTGSTAEQVKKSFNASGGPAGLCKQAVNGRYPFERASSRDIPLDDFTKLFAPGGLIDGFFNTQLRPYVDASASVWKGRPLDGVAAPIAPAELVQFQRAAAIRDLFFGAGGGAPSLRFDLIPVYLDPGIKQVTLELGGTTANFVPGPPKATQITWPGSGMSTARLAFDPPPKAGSPDFQATGPWALFRLFEQGNLQQADSSERYQLTFRSGERHVVFELRAGSLQNPFASNALHEFRCPNL